MALERILVFCLVLAISFAGKHDYYSGYSIHGVRLQHGSQQKVLGGLEQSMDVDILQYGVPGLRDAQIMVSPQNSRAVLDALDEHGLVHYLKVADVAKNLEDFDEHLAQYRAKRQNRLLFDDYPRYAEVEAYLEEIVTNHPYLATLVTAGNSFEGRPIKYLKISTTNFTDPSKPIFFMDAMIHAREWVTTPVALYSIHQLVVDLVEENFDLLDGTDWIILPVVNPDGYEYSHTDLRLWRRTRSFRPELNTSCYGVDGNRNFDIVFNTVGVSNNPCSDIYPGPEPFSEPETQYVRNILLEHLDRMQVYMNIHSYGSLILFGFGYDSSLTAHAPQLHHLGSVMGAAIDTGKLPKAPFYSVGNSGSLLYETSGAADDYALSIGVPFPYCLELPDFDEYNFVVPPEYINQINKETWRGIAATARVAKIYFDAGVRSGNI